MNMAMNTGAFARYTPSTSTALTRAGFIAGRTVALAAAVSGFGFMNGYMSNPKAFGVVPADLIGAFVGHAAGALAYMFGRGDMAQYGSLVGHAVGDAGLMSFLMKVSAGLGVDMASKSSAPPAAAGGAYTGKYAHMSGSSGVGALSAEEAAHYVHG